MDIQLLKNLGRLVQVNIDEYIFYQGEIGKSAYFILKGTVEVLVSSAGDGSLIKVAELSEGAIFGEMSLIDDKKRSATVRTSSECVFLVIDNENFDNIVTKEPTACYNLLLTLAERLEELYKKIEYIPEESENKSLIEQIEYTMVPISLSKNQKLFSKGEVGNSLAYILKGTIIVTGPGDYDNQKYLTFGAGDVVGISSLFNQSVRRENAEVVEDTNIVIVHREQLKEFFRIYPSALKSIVKSYSSEIRLCNDIYRNQKSVSLQGNYQIIEKEDNLISKTENLKIGSELFKDDIISEYLGSKDVKCPVCGETFEATTIRNSKLKVKSITKEYRIVYNDFDELWYHIWSCPKCRYHNYAHDFFNLTIQENFNLKKTLLKKTHNFRYIPHKKSNLNQVINEHYNLLLSKTLAESSALRQARVWLHMAWLQDDVKNIPERNDAYRKARKLYADGWYESKDPLTIEEDQKLSILLAELFLRDGMYKEAREYLLKAVQKKGNKAFNQRAQDRILDIRELIKENETSDNIEE